MSTDHTSTERSAALGESAGRFNPKTRVAIYSDHLSGIGGGEKYALSMIKAIASVVSVDVYARSSELLPNSETVRAFLGFDLNDLGISWKVVDKNFNFSKYDLFVSISHFFIPPPTAKTNLLVVFFPQMTISMRAPQYDAIATISHYSRKWVRTYWGTLSHLIYPFSERPSNTNSETKRNLILSVGRFFRAQDGNNKNQHLMIEVFRKLIDQGVRNWELVLAGSPASNQSDEYIKSLHGLVRGLPVRFVFNPTYPELSRLYDQASLFWHAAGFDEAGGTLVAPSAAEHFGIVVVEAMAAGAVPVVAAIGGPAEIVEDGKSGCVCPDLNVFAERTLWLIDNATSVQRMSEEAKRRASFFSEGLFTQEVRSLVHQLIEPGTLQRAISLARRGIDTHQAESLLLEEIERNPREIEGLVELGDLYYRLGNREGVFAMWNRAKDAAEDSILRSTLEMLSAKECARKKLRPRIESGQIYDEDYFTCETKAGLPANENRSAKNASVHCWILQSAFAPSNCLEIGCGKGELVHALRDKGIDAFGIDISQYAIGSAVESVRPYTSRSDAMPLLFSASSFDLVVAIDVLEHIQEEKVPIILKEFRRVCRKHLFVTVEDTSGTPPHTFFRDVTHLTMRPLSWWQGSVRAAGFEIIDVQVPRPEFRGHQIIARVIPG